ncbi:AraC family transcriptional regulator, partial [Pseudomonas paraeruginosa]
PPPPPLFFPPRRGQPRCNRWSRGLGDVYKRQARDLLVGELQEPPSLDALASRGGMNPRKLTAGFRKVFGASVFG